MYRDYYETDVENAHEDDYIEELMDKKNIAEEG